MLWIALHLPVLPLESFAAALDEAARQGPLALLEGADLVGVNGCAAALGVQPGMRRATALALAPQLVLGRADAARDAQALQAVAHAALAFTPCVTLQGADTVLLEVSTTLRVFGGLATLRGRLRAALVPLGHTWREACAPTPLGAALLARWGGAPPLEPGQSAAGLPALRARLDRAPVALLLALAGSRPEHALALQGMGVHTLVGLRALPRAGLARRFGPALLQALDRARGDAPDPREPLVLPEAFEGRLELFARADTSAQVLQGAQVLLARLVAWARARQARVRRCSLVMLHEPRHRAADTAPPSTTLELALAEASDDAAHLQRLLRERLDALTLPAPTLDLRLHCHDLLHGAPPSGELFASRASEREGLVRLLERLQARLGAQQVHQLGCVADHRPECAAVSHPVHPAHAAPPAYPAHPARHAPPRPLSRPAWLLGAAQPLHERHAQPLLDGHPLQLLAGPERIESGWWDGQPVLRDYFIAQARDSALVWVYRTRLPGAGQPAGWFLHGRFA